jgi:hypothetical protein
LTIRARWSPPRCRCCWRSAWEGRMTLFVGDDWAEDHHDVELLDDSGRRLGRASGDRARSASLCRRRPARRRAAHHRTARYGPLPSAAGAWSWLLPQLHRRQGFRREPRLRSPLQMCVAGGYPANVCDPVPSTCGVGDRNRGVGDRDRGRCVAGPGEPGTIRGLEGWHAALTAGRSCGALRAVPAPVLRRAPGVRVVVEETTIGSGDRLSGG